MIIVNDNGDDMSKRISSCGCISKNIGRNEWSMVNQCERHALTLPVTAIEAKRNAVIIELVGDRFVVSVECKEDGDLGRVKAMAKLIHIHCLA